MHKRAANTHQHSTFASTSERFKTSPSEAKDKLMTAEEEAVAYRTRVDANVSARKITKQDTGFGSNLSDFRLTTGMNSGPVETSQGNLTKIQFLKENPNYGFNSTTQRFSYL